MSNDIYTNEFIYRASDKINADYRLKLSKLIPATRIEEYLSERNGWKVIGVKAARRSIC
jgi:hypothetical protein